MRKCKFPTDPVINIYSLAIEGEVKQSNLNTNHQTLYIKSTRTHACL